MGRGAATRRTRPAPAPAPADLRLELIAGLEQRIRGRSGFRPPASGPFARYWKQIEVRFNLSWAGLDRTALDENLRERGNVPLASPPRAGLVRLNELLDEARQDPAGIGASSIYLLDAFDGLGVRLYPIEAYLAARMRLSRLIDVARAAELGLPAWIRYRAPGKGTTRGLDHASVWVERASLKPAPVSADGRFGGSLNGQVAGSLDATRAALAWVVENERATAWLGADRCPGRELPRVLEARVQSLPRSAPLLAPDRPSRAELIDGFTLADLLAEAAVPDDLNWAAVPFYTSAGRRAVLPTLTPPASLTPARVVRAVRSGTATPAPGPARPVTLGEARALWRRGYRPRSGWQTDVARVWYPDTCTYSMVAEGSLRVPKRRLAQVIVASA